MAAQERGNENPNLHWESRYAATANDIRNLFSAFGEVVAAHVFTAGKRRFGFVLMMNESDAESAIEGLGGVEFFGRGLLCQWAAKQRRERHRLSARKFPVERAYQ